MTKPVELVGADLGRELLDAAAQALVGLLVELRDAQNADVAPSARARTGRTLIVSRVSLTSIGSFDSLRWILSVTDGVDRAAHLVDGLVQVEALDRLAVDLRDDVVGENPGTRGRRVVDRRDDLHEAVFHRHLDAEAAEFAAGLHLHVTEALGVHVARMRIERGQHAVDGRFDELRLRPASRHNPYGSSRRRRRKG